MLTHCRYCRRSALLPPPQPPGQPTPGSARQAPAPLPLPAPGRRRRCQRARRRRGRVQRGGRSPSRWCWDRKLSPQVCCTPMCVPASRTAKPPPACIGLRPYTMHAGPRLWGTIHPTCPRPQGCCCLRRGPGQKAAPDHGAYYAPTPPPLPAARAGCSVRGALLPAVSACSSRAPPPFCVACDETRVFGSLISWGRCPAVSGQRLFHLLLPAPECKERTSADAPASRASGLLGLTGGAGPWRAPTRDQRPPSAQPRRRRPAGGHSSAAGWAAGGRWAPASPRGGSRLQARRVCSTQGAHEERTRSAREGAVRAARRARHLAMGARGVARGARIGLKSYRVHTRTYMRPQAA
jgi:hypothetical protein